ncbi:hypothetical protein SKAU_G00247730 [Synaphobranchus kaupii]|uniref:Uncharacterized protein n=1 Tax=Synaphobranchus kaupii TaxID=118154 RepID=A0A9Q1IRC5_SYNKA|nr:hypothetical protein SKAU_G00247730 [Synaphobranchus kaupii]
MTRRGEGAWIVTRNFQLGPETKEGAEQTGPVYAFSSAGSDHLDPQAAVNLGLSRVQTVPDPEIASHPPPLARIPQAETGAMWSLSEGTRKTKEERALGLGAERSEVAPSLTPALLPLYYCRAERRQNYHPF